MEAKQGSTLLEAAHGPFLETCAFDGSGSEDTCMNNKKLEPFS
jgi:hypothetical protein